MDDDLQQCDDNNAADNITWDEDDDDVPGSHRGRLLIGIPFQVQANIFILRSSSHRLL